ncbi:patatin-like phospholipase family protein [Antarcticibacterium sp. 1MA-6-2]|nr:patatin-like phospholipase family protein [Antarcticibacterium sp. 1MA-6-2]
MLKALSEHGIEPEIISGTSMGALIGVLYAAGHSPKDIEKIFIDELVKKVMTFSWQRTGLLKMEKLPGVLKKYLPEDDYSCLKKPFYLGITNLNSGKSEFLSKGKLYSSLIATSSVPGVFTPIVIDGTSYVDGGLLCNLPASAIREKCKILIGAHVNFPGEKKILSGTREILERVVNLGITQNTQPEKELCDFLIDPPEMRNFSLLDFGKIEEIIEVGYSHTNRMIEVGELSGVFRR